MKVNKIFYYNLITFLRIELMSSNFQYPDKDWCMNLGVIWSWKHLIVT